MSRILRTALKSTTLLVVASALAAPAAEAQQCGGLLGLVGGRPCPSPAPAPRPAAAPDPGGSEAPDQPVPAPGRGFGFNSALAISDETTPAQELDAASAAGANLHRVTLSWRILQPNRGDPPLPQNALVERIDSFHEAAIERGITPLVHFTGAPAWASKYRSCGLLDATCARMAATNRQLVPDTQHLDEFRRFVNAVKSRWPGMLIESWNSPNLYWKDARFQGREDFAASPQHFAAIQCAAYRGSKAVNDGPVLAAGWAMRKYSEYVGGVYAAGGANCWDIANIHAYPGTRAQFGEGSDLARLLLTARQLRERHQDSDPLWVTETGLSTKGNGAVDEQTQADGSRRLYNRLMTMGDVGAVIFHTLRDPSGGYAAGSREYGFGFLRSNWSAKPVYCGFVTRAQRSTTRC